MQRVAIIEDNASDLAVLDGILARYKSETEENFQVSVFTSGEDFLQKNKPLYDVVFIDIELAGMINGIQTAKKLREFDEEIEIIFVTNMAQFAIKGYEVNALDYFLKPISYYDVKMRLDRICRKVNSTQNEAVLNVSVNGNIRRIPASAVYYIEIINHTLYYHTTEGEFAARGSMRELERQLENEGFTRCSISYLVNLHKCSEIKSGSIVIGGDELRITRGKRKEFVYKLSKVINGERKSRGRYEK